MARSVPVWLTLVAALIWTSAPTQAQQVAGGTTVRVERGETREGDLYATGALVEIAGHLNGDLIAGAQTVRIIGPVDGDLFAGGRSVDIRGPVGDSTRIVGDLLTVDAPIDGDLVAAGNQIQVLEGARVTGDVLAAGAFVRIDGTVDGDVRLAGGEIVITGAVRNNATLRADRIDLAPGASIGGDLDYQSRTPLSPEAAARVMGTVTYEEQVEDDSSGITAGGVLFWGWQTAAALFAGLLAVALFRGAMQHLVSAIAGETTVGALLGFVAFLIVPAASVVTMVTVVGLPIGVSALFLFLVTLYLAKLPVAVWTGEQLLALAGRSGASPYVTMAVGVVALYVLFAIPYLGWLFWLAATWLGLGAIVLSGRGYLRAREA